MLGMVFAVLVLLQGCAPGYNSVVFATRSNIGLDANIGIEADTAPANLEVAISRNEGVLMPAFEGGQTVPVMASFTSDSSAFNNFFWGVKSTFATGEAAFTMSYLYDGPDKDKVCYKRVELSKIPDPQLPFGCKVHYVTAGEVKPVLFGTDTILGVKVKWSGQTGPVPSSVNIGFKRKEAAWAPIGVSPKRIPQSSKPINHDSKQMESIKPENAPGTSYEVDIPSLLATIDTNVPLSGTGGSGSGTSVAGPSARLTYLQYFATGSAANNLARRRAVREAMLKRSDPVQAQIAAEEGKKKREINRNLIDQIIKLYKANKNNRQKIFDKAKEIDLVEISIEELAKHEDGKSSITEKLKELLVYTKTL